MYKNTVGTDAQFLDFDEEARKLYATLNIEVKPSANPNDVSKWKHLDPIFRHPTGLGTIYVGNQNVAQNLGTLR